MPATTCSVEQGLIKIEHDAVTDFVYIGAPGEGPLQTDGKCALVRTKGPIPVLASVIGGRGLSWRGEALMCGREGQTHLERSFE